MKKYLSMLFLAIGLSSYSQSFGSFKLPFLKQYPKAADFEYDQWYKYDTPKAAVVLFKKTPIGAKKAIESAEEILLKNKISFESADDKTFLSALVENIKDYEMLNISIDNESSEVSKKWFLNGSSLILTLSKKTYSIIILNYTD